MCLPLHEANLINVFAFSSADLFFNSWGFTVNVTSSKVYRIHCTDNDSEYNVLSLYRRHVFLRQSPRLKKGRKLVFLKFYCSTCCQHV